MLSISNLKQAGQAALTLAATFGVTYGANKLINKGFQAWNAKQAGSNDPISLGTIQKAAKAFFSVITGTIAGAFIADRTGLTSLSDLASRVTRSSTTGSDSIVVR